MPNISFWGLFQVFCTGDSNSTAIIADYLSDNNETRIRFLKQFFEGVSVSPWNYLFASTKRSSKTESNLLTKLWHQTWKYEKTTKAFELTIQRYKSNPEMALNGLCQNIIAMFESGQIDCGRSGTTAFQLLKDLFPKFLSGPNQPDAERSLAVLLLICLLGESTVLGQSSLDVREWLDRRKGPFALLMFRSFHKAGLYHVEDTQIDTRLIPSIVCGKKRYDYEQKAGSPLRQILSEQQYRWIFLSGQTDDERYSAVSGAGKTTSLRFLALEEGENNILWLPLAEIYAHHNLKDTSILATHIKERYKVDLDKLPASTLFLLDGLDELIGREQLQRLSGELYMLQHSGKFGLIVSSKLPWDQMHQVDVFYEWQDVWKMFRSCTIQSLSKSQIKRVIPEQELNSTLFHLNSPFLLSLYLSTASLPDDPWTTDLISRWDAEALFHSRQLTDELLFYRSLIVQIIRWHEAAQGKNMQWEMDAFLLLHTMPAIACKMLRSESNDATLDLASDVSVGRDFIKRTIDTTWKVIRPWLHLFPGYGSKDDASQYIRFLQGLSYEKFLSGAVPSLFHGDWNGEDQYEQPRFVNQSLRDNLALLHIANVFLLAYNGALETTIEAIEAYGDTIELLPTKEVQKSVAFFDLISPGKNIKSILRKGPETTFISPLSQFLAGHIGGTICDRLSGIWQDKSISSDPWYAYMSAAFEQLEQCGDSSIQKLVAKKFGLAYIYSLTNYARSFRGSGKFHEADLCARQVIDFQSSHDWIINSDGYHMKALVLFDQVKVILNCDDGSGEVKSLIQDNQLDLSFAFNLADELEQLVSNPQFPYKTLPPISDEQKPLIPIFYMILNRARTKWAAYHAHHFFHNSSLEFLCSASYLAKAYSIFAALSPGNSGMAYNLLGTMLANDDEQLENNKKLAFFKANPELHLEIPGLNYEDRFAAAFKTYRAIYNIRRGPQPYSARRLCELLLRRQVALDENTQPIQISEYKPFCNSEWIFMEQAIKRAILNRGSSGAYWYARYLHEAVIQGQEHDDLDARMGRAERALQAAWKKCSCDKKLLSLKNRSFKDVDIISVLIIVEDLLMDHSKAKETRDMLYDQIFAYLNDYLKKSDVPSYTTGVYDPYGDVHDCLLRINRFKDNEDSFIVQHMMKTYEFKI